MIAIFRTLCGCERIEQVSDVARLGETVRVAMRRLRLHPAEFIVPEERTATHRTRLFVRLRGWPVGRINGEPVVEYYEQPDMSQAPEFEVYRLASDGQLHPVDLVSARVDVNGSKVVITVR